MITRTHLNVTLYVHCLYRYHYQHYHSSLKVYQVSAFQLLFTLTVPYYLRVLSHLSYITKEDRYKSSASAVRIISLPSNSPFRTKEFP